MIRFLLSAAIAALICLRGPAIADEVKGAAAVKVQDPKRGSIPELIYAYGTATPTSSATQTASFQRDGQVSEIFVEVGDQFRKGDKLLDFGASPAAVVAYEQAKTTLSLKQHALERKQQLFKQQLATRDDVENAEKDLSDAKSTLEMFERIGSIKPSEILEAPFDGVVTAISVSKGDRISAGAPLMSLSRPDHLILSVGVEAGALEKVKPELPVHLTSLLPGRKPSDGTVKRIGIAVDPKTRQVPVFVEVPDGMALSGENFKAGIEVGKFQGWVVPRDSVGTNAKGTFVFQIDEGHAKRVYVKVVGSVGKNSVIEGDIDSQKEMILSGNYQVDDGDAVRPEEAPQEEEEDEDN
jgi:membrane fusion protein (multidrug efflux system)